MLKNFKTNYSNFFGLNGKKVIKWDGKDIKRELLSESIKLGDIK